MAAEEKLAMARLRREDPVVLPMLGNEHESYLGLGE